MILIWFFQPSLKTKKKGRQLPGAGDLGDPAPGDCLPFCLADQSYTIKAPVLSRAFISLLLVICLLLPGLPLKFRYPDYFC